MLKAPQGIWGIIRARRGVQFFSIGISSRFPAANKEKQFTEE